MARRLLTTLAAATACCSLHQASGFAPPTAASSSPLHLEAKAVTSSDPPLEVVVSSSSTPFFDATTLVDVVEDSTSTTSPPSGTRLLSWSSSMEETVDSSANSHSNNLRDLPPVLQQITDERKNFQVNLGKAMDTLRKDYPYILKQSPDFSIYDAEITVVDPSGVQLTGLGSYKSSIKFMQQFIKFWFQERSGLQFRLVYDFARSSIRVSWHAVLVPKVPLGKPLHLDGICMYKLNADSGKVVEHKFEKLLINNTPVIPPYGVFSLLQQQDLVSLPGVGLPAGI